MPLPRRRLLAWLTGLLVGSLPWQSAPAKDAPPEPDRRGEADPVVLVDGWLLRRSDLDAIVEPQARGRHDP